MLHTWEEGDSGRLGGWVLSKELMSKVTRLAHKNIGGQGNLNFRCAVFDALHCDVWFI